MQPCSGRAKEAQPKERLPQTRVPALPLQQRLLGHSPRACIAQHPLLQQRESVTRRLIKGGSACWQRSTAKRAQPQQRLPQHCCHSCQVNVQQRLPQRRFAGSPSQQRLLRHRQRACTVSLPKSSRYV